MKPFNGPVGIVGIGGGLDLSIGVEASIQKELPSANLDLGSIASAALSGTGTNCDVPLAWRMLATEKNPLSPICAFGEKLAPIVRTVVDPLERCRFRGEKIYILVLVLEPAMLRAKSAQPSQRLMSVKSLS